MTLRLAFLSAATALLALAPVAASAADPLPKSVYRCGADGRSYSQTPCKEGRAVDADDARSDAQRQAALATVKADAKLAERMTREREARERAAALQGPTIIRDSRAAAAPTTAASTAARTKHPKRPPKTVRQG